MLSPLPIDPFVLQVKQGFSKSKNVILTAPPGTGKTLRVPAALARDLIEKKSSQKIVVLVPKRIAAVSAGARIAEENEWQLGAEVGYQVRFDQRYSDRTTLVFMTEGVFVKRLNDPAFLSSIDTIVFDEFHERSSLNDIAFGYCFEQQLLSEQNKELKILVMSATLDTNKIERFLENAVTVEVDLKPFPLEISKSKKAQRLLFDFTAADMIVDATKDVYRKQKKDVLVFLPGLYEIRLVQNKLRQTLPEVLVEILHGSIPIDEQKRILAPASVRRIILSTNVAESSLTLPSVDAVVDSGLEKKAVYERKIGFRRLELKRISLFSARQRAGRAARVGPGLCHQMWHETDERSMNEQIEPEVLRSSLMEETLVLLSIGVTDPQQFSWLDRPLQSFRYVLEKFHKWNLIDEKNKITSLGLDVQACPLDLERALLFTELSIAGFQNEAARLLAFLETTDFAKINHAVDLNDLQISDLGRKIETQLQKLKLRKPIVSSQNQSFHDVLIKTFLRYFPEKMAQRKEGTSGISTLGRGVQFANHLVAKDINYFLLLSGRDISDNTTSIDFAFGFSQKDFERLSQEEQSVETDYVLDFEKRTIYKQQTKKSGLFVLSVGTKTPLDAQKDKKLFQDVFQQHLSEFIENHSQAETYFKKIRFLQKKKEQLGYEDRDFYFLEGLNGKVFESLTDTVHSLAEFLDYELFQLLAFLTPDQIKNDLQKLSSQYLLPSGKSVPIDYQSEQAPMISARLQELLGVLKTPTLLDQRLKMTVELLAPNYRPTQITGDLESFWKTSYQDVRKDLRARYPKHDWPENPLDWKPEMSKRFKK